LSSQNPSQIGDSSIPETSPLLPYFQPPLCFVSGRHRRRRSSTRAPLTVLHLVLVTIATKDHRSVANVEFQHRTLAADDLTGTLISEISLPFFCTVRS
jgi:hypothetical protein